MKRLILPSGHVCLLSDEDFKKHGKRSWYALKNGRKTYVVRERLKAEGPGKFIISLHRTIAEAPPDKHVDHIDGDGLNNQRDNLRLCTVSQNQMNRGMQRNNTSGYKGVFKYPYESADRQWFAQIKFQRKINRLGRFKTKIEAAKAYDEAATLLFGEFAVLNFPRHQQMRTYKIADILTLNELEQLSRAVSASRLSFNKAATAWLESKPEIVSKLQAHGLHAPYFAYQIEALTK